MTSKIPVRVAEELAPTKSQLENAEIEAQKEFTQELELVHIDNYVKENALPIDNNKTECILIPNNMQNVDSYTFEIYGTGDISRYGLEEYFKYTNLKKLLKNIDNH